MGQPQVIGRSLPASLLIVSAYVVLIAVAAAADDVPSMRDDEVEMRIDTVLASNAGTTFEAPAALRQPFVGLFPYSSYRLLQGEERRVGWRREAEFLLPGGRYLVVVPRGYKDGRVLLNVMLISGTRPLVNTALALKNHGVFLMAGPRYQEGILVIAIGAGTTTLQTSSRTP